MKIEVYKTPKGVALGKQRLAINYKIQTGLQSNDRVSRPISVSDNYFFFRGDPPYRGGFWVGRPGMPGRLD